MKIYKSGYRSHWYSPYKIIDYMFFWTAWSKCSRSRGIVEDKDFVDHPAWVDQAVVYLNPISQAIHWVLDLVYPSINYVKIDYYDTWSFDHTLADIILPGLKQLRETKHGAPFTEDDDVPEYLRSHMAQPKENEWDTDSLHHMRWDWILAEMIFAFECKVDDSWEDAFRSGNFDTVWVPIDQDGNEVPKGEHKYYRMADGPKHTYKCDYEGMKRVQERITNGFRLFGRYYENLWD